MTPTQQLIAEARRHGAEMTGAPWNADGIGVFAELTGLEGYPGFIGDMTGRPQVAAVNANGVAWCRNNLRAIADALEAAPRWCERPTGPGWWVAPNQRFVEITDDDFSDAQYVPGEWYGPIPPAPGAPQP